MPERSGCVRVPRMHKVISPVNTAERAKLDMRAGDTVRVEQKVIEKGKTRLQAFEGLVLSVKHGKEAGSTFTVRATLSGVGVEKIFPLYSPMIEKIDIVRRSKVRRAKLYFIRDKAAKEVARQLRTIRTAHIAPEVEAEILERSRLAEREPGIAAVERTQ